MADAVLALNAGSSSLKFAVWRDEAGLVIPVSKGEIEEIGAAPHFIARDTSGVILIEKRWPSATFSFLVNELLGWVDHHLGGGHLAAVGHRVVHGGQDHIRPERLTDGVVAALEALTPLAPLHQPHCLAPIRAILASRPDLPQVACFDTAFHHTMPAVAARFALPRAYEEEGVRHYGFHGLSYEYIARRLREVAPNLASGRVVVAHLGNGASLCAMSNGRGVDTTMTFTALDGLMMGTRCGTLDPGVILYMLRRKNLSPDEIEHVLYEKSGLLGVSGLSGDMRVLLASDHAHAREAIELFVWRIARETAAMAMSLGGLDGFVFTAGIGEHAPDIRAAVCERLSWLGVKIATGNPAMAAGRISAPDSRVDVRVIATDEEAMIGQHTLDVLAAGAAWEGLG